ncbi:hypothetical protein CCAX7_63110 [Capsulimonas corticalis]|uniref:Uncharacterized protein n=1 Tax=Capsulimonas corticalis TaxID=2219043 RepID=A0A402CWS0_9BACT|nr:DUF4255 domain-containing protein [Capsulimonas corticalis]BDI34260.1 hypothetical protein CCAX7_63110 [Capsulimonas corticalis]
MAHSLILASVTAILKNIIENGLVDRAVSTSIGGDAVVSASSPDRITTGADEKPQINLFLYHVQPKGLYSQSRHAEGDAAGAGYPTNVELHYLVTAYGAQDLQIEVLLGAVLTLLSEQGTLTRDAIATILKTLSSTKGGRVINPMAATLADPQLMERLEQIKILPQAMNLDEVSRLWTTLQARFRPSAVYKVMVAIQNEPGESVA